MSYISRCRLLHRVPKGVNAVRNILGLRYWPLWILLTAGVSSCRTASQSWDQENLKRHDKGCPTAIWIAPGGNLEQC